MAELELGWIAERTQGAVVRGDPRLRVRSFSTDSRTIQPEDLFFAVVAARDGHDFVAAAAERGARGAVVSRPVEGLPEGFALIRVDDTARALQALAAAVLRLRLRWIVGITGSVGKTTTKEFTAGLLGLRHSVLKSEGNYNNRLGLALSLLRLESRHSAVVLEMGMSAPGEIRELISIAPPDLAVITNVNPVHLESLRTIDAVADAKWEIIEGLKSHGAAILNGDDAALRRRLRGWNGRAILFGLGQDCDVAARRLDRRGYEGFEFDLCADGRAVRTRLAFLTEAYLSDALAAAAVALAIKIPLDDIASAIGTLRPAPHRGGWKRLGQNVVLIDDSYNSNPKALDEALRGLAGLPAARRVAVLGEMLELGPEETRFHAEAGQTAAETGWNALVAVGPRARSLADAARAAGLPAASVAVFETSEDAAAAVADLVRPGDLVLVKGSRGAKTEIVVDAIERLYKES